jgi:hypothetical protein
MIYFLCCLGFVIAFICYKHKCYLEAENKDGTLSYALVTNALEVLFPFTVITLLYAVLSFSISDMGSDQITLEVLRKYERGMQKVQTWLKYCKLSSIYSFLLLGVWFLSALVVRYIWGQSSGERMERAYAQYETYNKWIKRVSVVVTLLASFTFFGSQVDGLGGELQAHIKTVQENYNAYASKVEQAVRETVATKVYDHVVDSAPAQYTRVVRLNSQTWERYSSLAKLYQSTKGKYAYESPLFEALVSRMQRQKEPVVKVIELFRNKR